MTALRVELFGLVCLNRYKKEQFSIIQTLFTKRYLDEIERPQIWDIMGEYNQAIARSATLDETGNQLDGRVGRARITGINLSRVNMFDKWIEVYVGHKDDLTDEDKESGQCIAHAANFIGVDIKRADSIAVKLLAAKLAERLGCDESLNYEALFRLSALIFGLHEGAQEALSAVDIQI